MADTISYSCLIPLKAQYRDARCVPHMFVRSDHTRRDGSRGDRYDATITIPKIGFRAFVRHGAIVKVECDLPKLLYGHNGRPIANQAQIDLAFSRIEHLLRLLCDPLPELGGLVPGRPVHENVRFTRVDFPWHFRDPDLRVVNLMRHAVHPDVRKANRIYPTGVAVPGCGLTVNFYDKGAQLKVATDQRYLRIEVQMRGDKLRRLFTGDPERPLHSISFDRVYQVYRRVLLGFDGHGVPVRGGRATLAETFAQIQLDARDGDVLETVVAMRAVSPAHKRKLRKEFSAAINAAEGFSFADILPETGPPPAYDLVLPERERRFYDGFVAAYGWPTGPADPLAEIYRKGVAR